MAPMPPNGTGNAAGPADPDTDTDMDAGGGTADTDDAGKTSLCIDVDSATGAITFEVEQGGQPGTPQPCADIGQALKMALQAYQQLNTGGGGDQASAQSAFDAGFQGGRGATSAPSRGQGGY